jgi:hypothetical protein
MVDLGSWQDIVLFGGAVLVLVVICGFEGWIRQRSSLGVHSGSRHQTIDDRVLDPRNRTVVSRPRAVLRAQVISKSLGFGRPSVVALQ